MTATAAQIAQIRRMVNEPTTTTYSDTVIQGFIETYPLMDELGTEPYYWTATSGSAPTKTATTTWYPTYDLNAAAAAIWDEKAATCAANYDFNSDGANYSKSQQYQQALNMSKYYRSKSAVRTITLVKKPDEASYQSAPWIGNLAEPIDPILPD
jgi:hypothetical protein